MTDAAPDRRTAAPTPDRAALPLTLALAVLAWLLTRNTSLTPGLNIPLLTLTLTVTLSVIARKRGTPPNRAALTVLTLGLLCAAGLATRDGTLATRLNALGLLTALTFGLSFLRFPGLHRLTLGETLSTLLNGFGHTATGLLRIAVRSPWRHLWPRPRPHTGRSRRILTGVLLTVPVLAVFGTLLGQADPRFAALFTHLPDWDMDLGPLSGSLLTILLWSFAAGGAVHAALHATPPGRTPPGHAAPNRTGLGLTELGVPLVSLSVLFCAYLLVETLAAPATGIVYSRYVRQGFGELSAVAVLTLAVLLASHALLRRDLRLTLPYRLMSAAVLLPLALLILSAYTRLSLYVTAYGLSETRVLGAVFLAWVTLALATYAVLGWRGRLERFAYFSLISGLSLTVTLDAVNPGHLIANVNLNRDLNRVTNTLRRTPQRTYLGDLLALGADSVPVIVAHLDELPDLGETHAERLATLRTAANDLIFPQDDWRTWNLGRARARALLP